MRRQAAEWACLRITLKRPCHSLERIDLHPPAGDVEGLARLFDGSVQF